VLTSKGDLQIVQLHRTDAGTYVCVAYNGIGRSVEREITLTVEGRQSFLFKIINNYYLVRGLRLIKKH
jgi:hypothetical protein